MILSSLSLLFALTILFNITVALFMLKPVNRRNSHCNQGPFKVNVTEVVSDFFFNIVTYLSETDY